MVVNDAHSSFEVFSERIAEYSTMKPKNIICLWFNKDAFACLGKVACPTPLPSGFAADPVVIALAQWVYTDAPEVAAYFQRAHLPFAEMNALLQNLSEPGATIESVADAFVLARGEIWQDWVGKPAASASSSSAPQ